MYVPFISRKYLFSRLIPFAAVFAVAFGVFVLIVVLAVMEGFKVELNDRIRGTLSHIMIEDERYQKLDRVEALSAEVGAVENVAACSPYIETMAMFRALNVEWCFVRGIDPVGETRIGRLAEYLVQPKDIILFRDSLMMESTRPFERKVKEPLSEDDVVMAFSHTWRDHLARTWLETGLAPEGYRAAFEKRPQPIVVGVEMIRRYGFYLGQIVPMTTLSLNANRVHEGHFMVTGAFHTGWYEYDSQYVYMTLPAARQFIQSYDEEIQDWRYSGMGVALKDYRNAQGTKMAIAEAVADSHPTAIVNTWQDKKANLLRAVNQEKFIMYILLTILVLFAGSIICLILILQVIEKTRDLGILQSIGATPTGIVSIFLLNGLVISAVGFALGFTGGVLFAGNINGIHDVLKGVFGFSLFPPEIYYLDRIPVHVDYMDLLKITIPTVLFAFVGSLIPAVRAARQNPIHALRYE